MRRRVRVTAGAALLVLITGAIVAFATRERAVDGTPTSSASTSAWRLVDGFSGPSGAPPSPKVWQHEVGGGGWGNGELQTYTDSTANAALDGHGHLVLTARRATSSGPSAAASYTSARLTTQGQQSFGYGTLQARLAFTSGPGLLPAFWLLGSDLPLVGYPQCGEIDVVEAPNADHIFTTVHGPTVSGATWSISAPQRGQDDAFHVYSLTRTATSIDVQIDGHKVLDVNRAELAPDRRWVFAQPFDVLLDIAVGGVFAGPPNGTTPFPATLTVDWIRYRPWL